MEIMQTSSSGEPDVKMTSSAGEGPETKPKQEETKSDIFSEENLAKESEVESDVKRPEKEINLGMASKDVVITPEEKISFIDALVANGRMTKTYTLFGGRCNVTVRSLTSDEVNALASWTSRQGIKDSAGLLAGRYRKYLLAAHVAMLDGVEMPPLEEPLYERLGEDGKTVDPPGWIKRCDYWDGVGFGKFQAILSCVQDFDMRYSILCNKAEDANFWNPDTP